MWRKSITVELLVLGLLLFGSVSTVFAEGVDLKVDLALPKYNGGIWEETLKPGWTPWAAPRWHDMYGHDCVLADGTGTGPGGCSDIKSKPGLAGTGIFANMSLVYEGRGGLIAAGLEMCNLNATCGPPAVSGQILYEPICNTWFHATDYANAPGSTILVTLYGLPPGEYTLTSYHNKFGGDRNGGKPHWECVCNPEPPMTAIWATPVAIAETLFDNGDYEWQKLKCREENGYNVGTATGVEFLEGAYNVEIQQVTTDAELVPSVIRFRTDGSGVFVAYEGNCCEFVPEDIRPQRESQRGILNAFEIRQVEATPKATLPGPGNNSEGVEADTKLTWLTGGYAVQHDVYFGTDYNAVRHATDVTQPPGCGRQTATTYDPGMLALGTTYYWRIDEVNEANPESPWVGDVWSFTTRACIDLEDFESFSDSTDLQTAWQTAGGAWMELATDDGRSGSKSAKLDYYNRSNFRYSELSYAFDEPQDLAAANVQAIAVFFKGMASNQGDKIYVALEDTSGKSAVSFYGGGEDDLKKESWQPCSADFQDFSTINLSAVESISIGVGDRAAGSASGATGSVLIDDISMCVPSCIDEIEVVGDFTSDCRVNFKDFSVMAGEWSQSEEFTTDLNGDGKLGLRDLKILADHWLSIELWP